MRGVDLLPHLPLLLVLPHLQKKVGRKVEPHFQIPMDPCMCMTVMTVSERGRKKKEDFFLHISSMDVNKKFYMMKGKETFPVFPSNHFFSNIKKMYNACVCVCMHAQGEQGLKPQRNYNNQGCGYGTKNDKDA